MDIEDFLIMLTDTDEYKDIYYKCFSMDISIGFLCTTLNKHEKIYSFITSLKNRVKIELLNNSINIDNLFEYIVNDKYTWMLNGVYALFNKKSNITDFEYLSNIAKGKVITPYIEDFDIDKFAYLITAYILDSLGDKKLNIKNIIGQEIFNYPTNSYNLTKINGCTFKRDGIIYDGKGYFYNIFTNKKTIDSLDVIPAFAKIILEETEGDILYRLDERLSMPESEYSDYSGVAFGKFYGPQFNFDSTNLKETKTIIVRMDYDTFDKLLMVIKRDYDRTSKKSFLHIELESLPYINDTRQYVITTFLHGMYYPDTDSFSHIDYTKNQYNIDNYLKKYEDSINGEPIDLYVSCKDLHYKIWCIENGTFSRETWYKLMIVSLPTRYQKLLDEILE